MATGALIGALRVTLGLDTAAFEKGMGQAQRQTAAFTKSLEARGAQFTKLGAVMTAGITAPFVALAVKSVPAAVESQQAAAQVGAALASMGDKSKRSADQLSDLAGKLQDISLFDDDDIMKSVTANMLTFGNVSGQVFDRAELAAVNLSARLGQDLQSSAIQVGKALNDPIKGVTALQRVGVSFTAQQKEQIKAMAAAGDLAGAQGIILGELEKQFGGAAEAQRKATPDAAMQQQWRTFQEVLGGLALKVLPPLTSALTGILQAFNQLSPGMQTLVVGGAAVAATLGPIVMGIGGLVSGFAAIAGPLASFASGLGLLEVGAGGASAVVTGLGAAIGVALPWVGAIAGAAALVYGAYQHWDEIAPILEGVWNSISTTFGPPLIALFNQIKDAALTLWNGPFGAAARDAAAFMASLGGEILRGLGQVAMALGKLLIAAGDALGPAFIGIFKAALDVIGTVVGTASHLLNMVVALLRGDFSGAWTSAQAAIRTFALGMAQAITDLVPNVLESLRRLVTGIGTALLGELGRTWATLKARIAEVGDWFYNLYDRVVGHSYVPDMVDEIGRQMGRLDAEMVSKAGSATQSTADKFRQLQAELAPILARLFPEQAAFNDFQAELAILERDMKAAGFTAAQTAEAIDRLREEYLKKSTGGGQEVTLETPDIVDVGKAGDEVLKGWEPPAIKLQKINDQVIESYARMAEEVAGSLRGLVDTIKSGDWLGALQSVLDIVTKLASSGVFGKGMQSTVLTNTGMGTGTVIDGARASGGPVWGGGSFLVGERGPELFLPKTSGTIIPNSALAGAGRSGNDRPLVFDMRGAVMTQDLLQQMQGIANDRAITVVGAVQRRGAMRARQRYGVGG